jgi:hypothetical protein
LIGGERASVPERNLSTYECPASVPVHSKKQERLDPSAVVSMSLTACPPAPTRRRDPVCPRIASPSGPPAAQGNSFETIRNATAVTQIPRRPDASSPPLAHRKHLRARPPVPAARRVPHQRTRYDALRRGRRPVRCLSRPYRPATGPGARHCSRAGRDPILHYGGPAGALPDSRGRSARLRVEHAAAPGWRSHGSAFPVRAERPGRRNARRHRPPIDRRPARRRPARFRRG